ncbi:hypothetical protein C2E25_04215 [Geothermobacter hydrogeniphilus]|uniref:Plasmid stabilization system protein ParE n=1 Tax=Geothermobacter hydrogeniphilus TaxID=1969733 RepID=A0A2K2HCL1_9BACT|nr:type II toxin-antitoxin system RelE/ParE family toxin [Geothermobacter hydrogeniphilus]PNU21014.1 hypothetical protein C2E25_04215 [Geothermobacter hydrogeniphilus]
MSRRHIQVTRNFRRNLDEIETFLAEADAAWAFEALLDDLFTDIIPRLEVLPELGKDFLQRRTSSHEATTLVATLQQRPGDNASVRELIRGDYLILYARQGNNLYLLAIKHHRQLSFDFPERWED